eukprot:COSAG02_NODE_25129_length_668_cov_1.014060_1_plen_151_part_01
MGNHHNKNSLPHGLHEPEAGIRDVCATTTFPSFTTTAYSTIPLAIWLPESRPAPTIPPWISLPESPPAPTIPPWISLPESPPPAPHTVSHHVPTSHPSPRHPHDTQGPAVGSFEPQSDFVPIGGVAAAYSGDMLTIFPIGHDTGHKALCPV